MFPGLNPYKMAWFAALIHGQIFPLNPDEILVVMLTNSTISSGFFCIIVAPLQIIGTFSNICHPFKSIFYTKIILFFLPPFNFSRWIGSNKSSFAPDLSSLVFFSAAYCTYFFLFRCHILYAYDVIFIFCVRFFTQFDDRDVSPLGENVEKAEGFNNFFLLLWRSRKKNNKIWC